jgi:hypothetical protein
MSISFNEPSKGEVTADNDIALLVINNGNKGAGISGQSSNWMGVYGESQSYQGVHGTSTKGAGVVGQSVEGWGVYGASTKVAAVQGVSEESTGVAGVSKGDKGTGVWGTSNKWIGVFGESQEYQGVHGTSTKNAGVVGQSVEGWGVYGKSESGVGVYAEGPTAGYFKGNVEVTGDIELLNGDCAEEFDIVEENVEAGTVMVLNEMGSLQPSCQEYDKKVAGIISGASGYKPAIVLDRQNHDDKNQNGKDRMPIALMGKVYCKVDARHSSIEIGDLLTTSSKRGYAMKAEDPIKAFGTVIGKALGSIKEGLGMIPVLVALQ